ncbi:putative hydroxypyruvate isomerase isoform X2 [Phymastichus coffea]|nr:putative hydroxypyruvate isomerase isoform X2 [Phymastichus coffea]XP_058804101.1 putative hydroxypyruvate isomerase isoform X2 [Phymastichus coffea]XP_058804102.1 putative hydroxypyruvate isomerase isoform X2 [Phymastichus coffea]XP_058804103.1 putative hydroxypyruvate isomerase isoform X2 [Phymastichus coffea]
MAHKFASNLSFMFQEVPSLIDRYQVAKDAGFKAVESGFPLGFSMQQVAQAKEAAGIEQILINVFTGDTSKGQLGFAAIPGKEKDFRDSIDLTIQYAKALDCKKIHVMAGKVENSTPENDITYENNLKYAVEKFAAENIIGLIEPINSITVPNYYLNDYKRAIDVIQKINSPNLKLLMDIFHVQQITGKITKTIEDYFPHIGHVQIAQVPSRNEPDVLGEIDYRYVFLLLEKLTYNEYIGLEYKPLTTSTDGLKWVKNFGFTL